MFYIEPDIEISWSDDTNIVVPILSDRHRHWSVNRLSFAYIYNTRIHKEALVGIHHNDLSCVSESFLLNFIGKDNYVYRKKHIVQHRSNFEAEMMYWFCTNEKLPVSYPYQIRWYWSNSDVENVNDCIPIMKWLEYCRDVKDGLLLALNKFAIGDSFRKYNDFVSDLAEIEFIGLNPEKCEYNPYTLTGRPSNHFGNINYAALNKSDGSRKRFVSRYSKGVLVEIDFSGFHLYLIYSILGLPFPEQVYVELSKYYPEGVNPKDYTFKQIYGGVEEGLRDIEPFKYINELVFALYKKFINDELFTFIFEKPIIKEHYDNITPTKLFNYMLQNLETEFNAEILKRINELLTTYNTKLILYTYDSFLFDYDPADTIQVFKEIIQILGGVPFHLKVGTNYDEMRKINI